MTSFASPKSHYGSPSTAQHSPTATAEEVANRRIRCFVRVRPILASDRCGPDVSPALYRGHDGQSLCVAGCDPQTFDEVFAPDATTSSLVSAVIVPAVDDVLSGRFACVACYGTTGSGKSYTTAQLLPAFVSSLIQIAGEESANVETRLFVECVQIYLESVHDLLDPSKKNLQLRESEDEGVFVRDSTQVEITTEADFAACWDAVIRNRAVAATQLNASSSRSHCIVTLRTTRRKRVVSRVSPSRSGGGGATSSVNTTLNSLLDVSQGGGAANNNNNISSTSQHHHQQQHDVAPFSSLSILRGRMQFVDLAGSERLKKSGSVGMRQAEAQYINQSLSTLGKVIHALADRHATHVPYRDSRLTRLMQDALGCGGTSSIIVTVSPNPQHVHETKQSLAFGMRAMQVLQSVTTWEAIDPQSRMIATQDWLEQRVAGLERECLLLETDRDAARAEAEFYKNNSKASASAAATISPEQKEALARSIRRELEEEFSQQLASSLDDQRAAAAQEQRAEQQKLQRQVAMLQKQNEQLHKLVDDERERFSAEEELMLEREHRASSLLQRLTGELQELKEQHEQEQQEQQQSSSRAVDAASQCAILNAADTLCNMCHKRRRRWARRHGLDENDSRIFRYGEFGHLDDQQQEDDSLTEVSGSETDSDHEQQRNADDDEDDDPFNSPKSPPPAAAASSSSRRRRRPVQLLKSRNEIKSEWSLLRRAVADLEHQVAAQSSFLALQQQESDERHWLSTVWLQQRAALLAALSRAMSVRCLHAEAGAAVALRQLETLQEMRRTKALRDSGVQVSANASTRSKNVRDAACDPVFGGGGSLSSSPSRVSATTQTTTAAESAEERRRKLREAEVQTVALRKLDAATQLTAAGAAAVGMSLSLGGGGGSVEEDDDEDDLPMMWPSAGRGGNNSVSRRGSTCVVANISSNKRAVSIACGTDEQDAVVRCFDRHVQCEIRPITFNAGTETLLPPTVASAAVSAPASSSSFTSTAASFTQTPASTATSCGTMTVAPAVPRRVDSWTETDVQQHHQQPSSDSSLQPICNISNNTSSSNTRFPVTVSTQVPAEWQLADLETHLGSVHENVAESLLLALRQRRRHHHRQSSSSSSRYTPSAQRRRPSDLADAEDDDQLMIGEQQTTPVVASSHAHRDAFTEPEMEVAYGHSVDYCRAEMERTQQLMRLACARASKVTALSQMKANLLLRSSTLLFTSSEAAPVSQFASAASSHDHDMSSTSLFSMDNNESDGGRDYEADFDDVVLSLTPIKRSSAAPAAAAAAAVPPPLSVAAPPRVATAATSTASISAVVTTHTSGTQCEQQHHEQVAEQQTSTSAIPTTATLVQTEPPPPAHAAAMQTVEVECRGAATSTDLFATAVCAVQCELLLPHVAAASPQQQAPQLPLHRYEETPRVRLGADDDDVLLPADASSASSPPPETAPRRHSTALAAAASSAGAATSSGEPSPAVSTAATTAAAAMSTVRRRMFDDDDESSSAAASRSNSDVKKQSTKKKQQQQQQNNATNSSLTTTTTTNNSSLSNTVGGGGSNNSSTARVLDLDAPTSSRAPTPDVKNVSSNTQQKSSAAETTQQLAQLFHARRLCASPSRTLASPPAPLPIDAAAATSPHAHEADAATETSPRPPSPSPSNNNNNHSTSSLTRVPPTDMDAPTKEQTIDVPKDHRASEESPRRVSNNSNNASNANTPRSTAGHSQRRRPASPPVFGRRNNNTSTTASNSNNSSTQQLDTSAVTTNSSNGTSLVLARYERMMETRSKLDQLRASKQGGGGGGVGGASGRRGPVLLPASASEGGDLNTSTEQQHHHQQESSQRKRHHNHFSRSNESDDDEEDTATEQFESERDAAREMRRSNSGKQRRRAATPTPRLSRQFSLVMAEAGNSSVEVSAVEQQQQQQQQHHYEDRFPLTPPPPRPSSSTTAPKHRRSATPPVSARFRSESLFHHQQSHSQQQPTAQELDGLCQFCDVADGSDSVVSKQQQLLDRRCQRALARFNQWRRRYSVEEEQQRSASAQRSARVRLEQLHRQKQNDDGRRQGLVSSWSAGEFEKEEEEQAERFDEHVGRTGFVSLDAYPSGWHEAPRLERTQVE